MLASEAEAQLGASPSDAAASGGTATTSTDPFRVVKPPFLGLPPPASPTAAYSSRRSGGSHSVDGSDDGDAAGAPALPPATSRVAVPRYSRPVRGAPGGTSSSGSAGGGGSTGTRSMSGAQLGERIAFIGGGERGVGVAAGDWLATKPSTTPTAVWQQHETDASSTQCGSVSSLQSLNTTGAFKGRAGDGDGDGDSVEDDGIEFEVALESESDSGGAYARAALRRDPLPSRYAAVPVPSAVLASGPARRGSDADSRRHPSSQQVPHRCCC